MNTASQFSSSLDATLLALLLGTRTLLVTKGIATRNKDATGNKEQEFKEIRTPRTPSRKNHD